MMNIKKYRAATTREALEQIKQDLGEDAFVLETKQVKSGGFFGLRSEIQIEVSAAAPNTPKPIATATAKTAKSSSAAYHSILNLTDDTLAVPPAASEADDFKKNNLLNALDVRAAAARDFDAVIADAPVKANRFSETFETVEITEDAPRLIHQKPEAVKTLAAPTAERNHASINLSENSAPGFSSRDMEMLRAEMREIKFSLGAFANRQNSQAWQSSQTILQDEMFNSPFYESYLDLTATGISPELAQKLIREVMPHFREVSVAANEVTKITVLEAVSSMIRFEADPLKNNRQAVLAFVGATGVGKTTTIAKIAARIALHEQRRVELVTIDTYRIAAVEQLKTYAEIIGAGCHVVRSVFELDAVLHRLPTDATVLIDTTGRNPHDLADQHELSDYLRRRGEIRKCLTIQATTHPLDGLAAINKFEMYGVDCLAFTKMDETTRPGALLELAANSRLPLAYFCMGQRVPEDLQLAEAENFADYIFR